MLTPNLAQVTLQFLQRVTLQPNEIAAYQAASDALTEIAQPTPLEAVTDPDSGELQGIHDGRGPG